MDDQDEYGNFNLDLLSDDNLGDDELSEMMEIFENSLSPNREQHRFKMATEEELKILEDGNQSKSTKKNTKWGLRIFNDWCTETEQEVDFYVITSVQLAEKLRQFYAVAQPRKENDYYRNSMKNLRAALNRHLRDIGREIDIVRDREFQKANVVLNGFLKLQAKSGKAKPTAHKPIIKAGDFPKIKQYLELDSPISVLYRAWYLIAVHFVSRDLEFHKQLLVTSFYFDVNDEGREYAALVHDTVQKTAQGGLNDPEPQPDKRMYASNGSMCPMKTLKLFVNKSSPLASNLFCGIKPSVTTNDLIWYTPKPLSQRKFQSIMPTIPKEAGLSRIFTAHSLRATAITALNDAGVELRHIMYMSGHRNESSIRSYNRGCSNIQKRQMSDVLQSKCVPSGKSTVSSPNSSECTEQNQAAATQDPPIIRVPTNENPSSTTTVNSSTTSLNYNFPLSPGFFSRGMFNNCNFNIYTK